MHWLYFSDHSPRQLEDAGFAYDSTCGYNDAVGYRAGTSQVFRLPGTQSFLELPLTIMDSALFYTDRMGLDRQEAMERCRGIVQHARRFGGRLPLPGRQAQVIVSNRGPRDFVWNDHHWVAKPASGGLVSMLSPLASQAGVVWFATAGQAVDWFRWRRAIRFSLEQGSPHVHVEAPTPSPQLPAACLIVHRPVGRQIEAEETRFAGQSQTLRL